MPPGHRRYFMIFANMRCGTTWTQLMLGELSDVATDYEFKWAPSYEPQPLHYVIPDKSFSCRRALDTISATDAIVGSKIVLDFLPLTSKNYRAIRATIEPEIAIIHIVRDYWEIIRSFRRGFFHLVGRPHKNAEGKLQSALAQSTDAFREYEAQSKHAQSATIRARDSLHVLWTLLRNDLCAAKLARDHRYLRLNYDDVSRRFGELTRFVGSNSSDDEIARVAADPPTKRLPQFDLDPNRCARALCCSFNMMRAAAFAGIDLLIAGRRVAVKTFTKPIADQYRTDGRQVHNRPPARRP